MMIITSRQEALICFEQIFNNGKIRAFGVRVINFFYFYIGRVLRKMYNISFLESVNKKDLECMNNGISQIKICNNFWNITKKKF